MLQWDIWGVLNKQKTVQALTRLLLYGQPDQDLYCLMTWQALTGWF